MSLILGASASAGQTGGQGDEPGGATPGPMEAMRRMAEHVALTQTKGGGQSNPVVLHQEPLIRYGDPAHNVLDGTVWAWGDRGRPTALLKVEDRRGGAGETFWGMSVTSLSTDRVALEFDGLSWESRGPGMELRPLPDAPRTATVKAQRLSQAKTLARRFAGRMTPPRATSAFQLRLLTQPLDRYEDPAAGLLDGVLFTLTVSTNPTIHVVLEAWADASGVSVWSYGLVRHGGAEMTAFLDSHEVWTVPLVNSPTNADTYSHKAIWSRKARP